MGRKIKCRKCNDIIESRHRHDFRWCKCQSIAVDGGNDYLKTTGNEEDICYLNDDLTEWIKEAYDRILPASPSLQL